MSNAILTLSCLLVIVFGSAYANPITIGFLSDKTNEQHTDMSQFFEHYLKDKNSTIHYITRPLRHPPDGQLLQFGIALGAQNCQIMSRRILKGRLLCLDLHHAQLLSLLAGPHSEQLHLSGIPVDAPPDLTVKAVRHFFPQAKIGVLLGPDSSVLLDALQQLPPSQQPDFRLVRFEDSPLRAFRTFAKTNNIIIAFYDQHLYNSDTLESLFLSSFRLDVPVVGFSEKLTQAGALFSLHSTLLDQKDLVASVLDRWLNLDKPIPSVIGPSLLESSVNTSVGQAFNRSIAQEDLDKWVKAATNPPQSNFNDTVTSPPATFFPSSPVKAL